jgi:hypothetical protein
VSGCPLVTSHIRCEWHASGTAGEDDGSTAWLRGRQLDRQVKPVLGDLLRCWQATGAARQPGMTSPSAWYYFHHSPVRRKYR